MAQRPTTTPRRRAAAQPRKGARPRPSLGMRATRAHPRLEAPEYRVIETPEALRSLIDSYVQRDPYPRALGLAVLLAAEPGRPRSLQGDPRRADLAMIALAAKGEPVHLIDSARIQELAPLQELLSGARENDAEPTPPYVVMHNAHLGLTALARRGLDPARFGCTRVAATLLAEGADGRRSDRALATLVADSLERSLPGSYARGLAEGELGATVPVILSTAASALVPLMRTLTPRLREHGLSRVYELECQVLKPVIRMEAAGMPVDGARFQRVAQSWARERQTLLAERPSDGASAEQLTSGPAVDRGAKTDEDPEEAARTARLARLEKLLSTFAHWPRDHVDLDGRIRYHLDPIATDSGRFACSQPNLQQVPSEHTAPGLRACFRPAPGRVFVIADYAQIELRVAAHLARCPVLRRVFHDGRDPHRATAATLARKPESAISARERKLAKAVNFGFLFGMGARRFQAYAAASYGLELTPSMAQRARDAFFATYPGLAAWHRRVGALGRGRPEDVTVRTALGRHKRFPAGRFSFTAALNIPVQGTAAEGFKLAMIDLCAELDALGGGGVLCVHDEYIAEVPEQVAELARARVQATMERAMARVVPSVPIVAEARVARSWGEDD